MTNRTVTITFTFLVVAILGFWLGFLAHLVRLRNEVQGAGPLLMVQIDDVGDGDAAYLNAPGGLSVLVDSGPDEAAAAHVMAEERRLSRSAPNAIVVTSCETDSIGGLPYLLRQWQFHGPVILPCDKDQFVKIGGSNAQAVVDAASEVNAPIYSYAQCESNSNLQLLLSSLTPTTNCQITLVPVDMPSGAATAAMALRIDYNEGSMLYAAGLTPQDQDMLIAQRVNLNCDVLAVAGDDGDSALSNEFLALTQPSVVTLSNSQEAPPSAQLLGRLRAADAVVGRTDVSGAITLGISADPATPTQFFGPNAILPQQPSDENVKPKT